MALFVQIDHFRKTDQKPTVKNHLFSISWFRSFNRTSFQQQLKLRSKRSQQRGILLQSYILSTTTETFQGSRFFGCEKLQSYILSTTTETRQLPFLSSSVRSFNRTSFQQQQKLIPKKGKIPPLTKLSLIFNRQSKSGKQFSL